MKVYDFLMVRKTESEVQLLSRVERVGKCPCVFDNNMSRSNPNEVVATVLRSCLQLTLID